MRKPAKDTAETNPSLTVRRACFAAFPLALLRPGDAKGAALHSNGITLDLRTKSPNISFDKIETVDVKRGWLGYSVRIRLADENKTVSGLIRLHAQALADGLEAARIDWWRKTLDEHKDDLQSVHADIVRLADPVRYTRFSVFSRLKKEAAQVADRFPKRHPHRLSASDEIKKLEAIRIFVQNPDDLRTRANDTFVSRELERSRTFFDNIEAKPLTDEQRKTVVIDEDHNLVAAAAGSGKTSVIVAKAGWLIEKGYRKPSDILLLAYGKDVQTEMEERIRQRLGDEVASELSVRTFHGLGSSIIGKAERKRPTLAKVAEDDRALFDLLKDIIADLIEKNPTFSKLMTTWFQNHFAPYRSVIEFQNWDEYRNYIRTNEIRALNGDKVKSFEECEIANFLYLNGVPYEYERPYEHETATSEKRQYKPDFHLSESGIYIEHFALSASGDTPPFIDRDEYHESRKWKLDLHKEKGTTLIETFSHEKAAGKRTENLAEKLNAHGVKLSPIPPEDVFNILDEQGRISPFTHLIKTFFTHFKGARLSEEEIAGRAAESSDRLRAEAFVKVFNPIYERYENRLAERKEIDFHDMIVRATDLVESGRYKNPPGYILVDEFQDISLGRSRLLKALLDRSPDSQLFAVGDDWQAIYRFAGSDIAIMRGFEERFGASERNDLGTTFRCSEGITSVATKFILENPAQLRKEVSSTRQIDEPCVNIGFPAPEVTDLLTEALRLIEADASKLGGPASVFVLGRYKHSNPKSLEQLKSAHPKLDISYMTVHRSKGQEADYVIVVDLGTGKFGFPTEIVDDPILDIVLAAPEDHPNAEERRLFYVAMTRARRRVFLLANEGPSSPFIKELSDIEYEVGVFGDIVCPTCVEGRLKRKESASDIFYECSEWPGCEHSQSTCPYCSKRLPVKSEGDFFCRDCGQPVESCPRCDGWLQKKNGRYGLFFGCSNWRDCDYTKNQATARHQ